MKFETAATTNPIDQLKVVGKPTDRIDGKFKTTGTAPYAYERHDVAPNAAYGYVVGSGIPKGSIRSMNLDAARRAPGVLAIVSTLDTPRLERGRMNAAYLFGGPDIQHYHQAIAVVVAETFEQARAASYLINVDYAPTPGRFDLTAEAPHAKPVAGDSGEGSGGGPEDRIGDFERAFAAAPVQLDETYTTPDESHSAMEPHATVAAWDGDKVTLWTSNQMVGWAHGSMAKILGVPQENVRIDAPYIGGGFGGKLFVRADAVLAALAAKAAKRPVKVALTRPLIANNTTHRPATIQRIRIGATQDGTITAIA
jgi:xanthine dehydrogenase YagR molybdenum-binding subunit